MKEFILKNKFRAVAYLKRESYAHPLSSKIMLGVFLGYLVGNFIQLVWGYSKKTILDHLPKNIFYGFSDAAQPHMYKTMGLLTIILILFIFRDDILRWISGLIPRKSHIDILQKIDLVDKELILMIDEVDRIKDESAKLVFDEVLNIKESFKKRNKNTTNQIKWHCSKSKLIN